jgi:ribosomal protein S18 acetylase RimI-like enzyme
MKPPCSIRRATVEHARAIAEVHVRSWQKAYRELLPEEGLNALSVEERAATWEGYLTDSASETAIAERSGMIAGFVSYGPRRDGGTDSSAAGEIMALYVAPDAWRTGIGARLCEHALAELTRQGFPEVTLWVLSGNDRARRFYEQMGFRLDGAAQEAEILGRRVSELRYARFLDEVS